MIMPYQLTWYTGYANLLFFLLILLTCRCAPAWKIAKKTLGDRAFNALNKHHCLYWWGFALSVAVHVGTILYPDILA
jgi:branched-subunit amino acid transport protein AzlD